MGKLRNFLKNTNGGFAIWTGVMAVPLMIGIGSAFDYVQLEKAKTYLQDLTDSAALAAARDHTLDEDEKEQIAKNYIEEAFDTNYPLEVLTVDLDDGNDAVQVISTATVKTMILGIIGMDTYDLTVLSEVKQSSSGGPVEISFVLDTTSSMRAFGAQWNRVVIALEDLMTDLADDSGGAGQFKASLVPFGDRVNLGSRRMRWIDRRFLRRRGASRAYRGCTEPRAEMIDGNPHRLTNATPRDIRFTPSTIGTYDYVRQCPSEPIAYPTHNINRVKRALRRIRPTGTGRFDIGLAWGYRMLSTEWRGTIGGNPQWPDTNRVTKVAVFLTDGYSFAYEREVGPPVDPRPWGWNHGTPEGFENLLNICDQMKADDIVIHVLGVNVNPDALNTLQSCATDANHYHSIRNANEVIDAIGEIGIKTTALRLSR